MVESVEKCATPSTVGSDRMPRNGTAKARASTCTCERAEQQAVGGSPQPTVAGRSPLSNQISIACHGPSLVLTTRSLWSFANDNLPHGLSDATAVFFAAEQILTALRAEFSLRAAMLEHSTMAFAADRGHVSRWWRSGLEKMAMEPRTCVDDQIFGPGLQCRAWKASRSWRCKGVRGG